MGLLQGRAASCTGLVAMNRKGPAETLQTPQRHELEAGAAFPKFNCAIPQLRVLRFWPTMGFFSGVAESPTTATAMAKTP